jgi:hypothetical protein
MSFSKEQRVRAQESIKARADERLEAIRFDRDAPAGQCAIRRDPMRAPEGTCTDKALTRGAWKGLCSNHRRFCVGRGLESVDELRVLPRGPRAEGGAEELESLRAQLVEESRLRHRAEQERDEALARCDDDTADRLERAEATLAGVDGVLRGLVKTDGEEGLVGVAEAVARALRGVRARLETETELREGFEGDGRAAHLVFCAAAAGRPVEEPKTTGAWTRQALGVARLVEQLRDQLQSAQAEVEQLTAARAELALELAEEQDGLADSTAMEDTLREQLAVLERERDDALSRATRFRRMLTNTAEGYSLPAVLTVRDLLLLVYRESSLDLRQEDKDRAFRALGGADRADLLLAAACGRAAELLLAEAAPEPGPELLRAAK